MTWFVLNEDMKNSKILSLKKHFPQRVIWFLETEFFLFIFLFYCGVMENHL